MADFANFTADFIRFAAQQGYPTSLVWASPEDVLFWRGRVFVLAVDLERRRLETTATYHDAMARGVGISIEGKCRTETATISRIYVPNDEIDAQYRMIPATGVKMRVPVNPLPAVLIKKRALWWVLKRLGTWPVPFWD